MRNETLPSSFTSMRNYRFNNSSVTRGIIGLDILSNSLKFTQLPNSKDAAQTISPQLTFHKSAVR